MASRNIVYRFTGDVSGLRAATASAAQSLGSAKAAAAGMATQMYAAGSKVQAVGFAFSRLTLPATIASGAMVKMAIDFNDSMSKVERLADVNHSQMIRWQKEILRLAPQVAKSPQDLAESLYFIASSGVPAAHAMDVLTISAKASAAGLGETQKVADGLTSVLNVYGYENITAAKAADILTRAVQLGKGEADQYASVIGRVTPVAHQLSIPFKDVAAAMSVVTNRGLSVSEAATGIRQAMIALQKPTKEGARILAMSGLSFEDIRRTVKEKGLLEGLRQLKKASGGNAEAFSKLLPNVRGLNAALMLTDETAAPQVNDIFAKMTDTTGTLDSAFNKASNTTKFKLNKALSQLKTAGTEIGEALLPALETLADWVGKVADKFTDMDENTRKWVGIAIIATAAIGPMLRMFGSLLKVMSVFVNHPFLAAMVILIAIAIYLYNNWKPFHDLIEKVKDILTGDGMKEGIDALNKGLDENSRVTRKTYEDMGFFQRRMYDVGVGVGEFKENWKSFTRVMSDGALARGWEEITTRFKAGIDRIYGWLESWGIVEMIGGIWNNLATMFQGFVSFLGGILKFFIGLFTLDWSKMWEGIKDIAFGIWTVISNAWGYLWRFVVEVVGGALGAVLNIVKTVFGWIWNVVAWFVGLIKTVFFGMWDNLTGGLAAAWAGVQWLWGIIWGFISSIPGTIRSGLSGAWDGFSEAFKKSINWIIDKWNGLRFSMPEISTPFGKIGGWTWDTPDIPRLARGAVVDQATLAIIGEAGREVVFPTKDPARGFDLLRQAGVELPSSGPSRGRSTNVQIVNNITAVDPSEAARKWGRQTMWDLKSNGVLT